MQATNHDDIPFWEQEVSRNVCSIKFDWTELNSQLHRHHLLLQSDASRRRADLSAISLTSEQVEQAAEGRRHDLATYFGLIVASSSSAGEGKGKAKARTRHEASRESRHWLAHKVSDRMAAISLLAGTDLDPLPRRICIDWYEDAFKTPLHKVSAPRKVVIAVIPRIL